MAKRRTKKQKSGAKHNLKISWDPNDGFNDVRSKNKKQRSFVKRNSNIKTSSKERVTQPYIDPINSSTKKAIIKSLGLAGFILSLEVVIYLFL